MITFTYSIIQNSNSIIKPKKNLPARASFALWLAAALRNLTPVLLLSHFSRALIGLNVEAESLTALFEVKPVWNENGESSYPASEDGSSRPTCKYRDLENRKILKLRHKYKDCTHWLLFKCISLTIYYIYLS